MDERFETFFPILFPFLFVAMWLTVTTICGLLSGWYWLQRTYPPISEPPLLKVRRQSGSMGLGVAMGGILTLSACSSGLGVGISRMFGPFQRPFLVPWNQITAEPSRTLFAPMVRLRLGKPEVGRLKIHARTWERLAVAAQRVAGGLVPMAPAVSIGAVARGIVLQWATVTTIAAIFFYFASRSEPDFPGVPLVVCIGFPGTVFGIALLFEFLRQARPTGRN